MKLDMYQKVAHRTSENQGDAELAFVAMGLASEAGELIGLVKKMARWMQKQQLPSSAPDLEGFRIHIREELGDILWYLAEFCTLLGFDMNEIAEENLSKLSKRYRI